MIREVFICDRCGKALWDKDKDAEVFTLICCSKYERDRYNENLRDLCRECCDSLEEWMSGKDAKA